MFGRVALIIMATDSEVLLAIDSAFGSVARPEHFTDFKHCCECAEHDALLRSRDRQSLTQADIGNPGWDPICFASPEGLAYYLPCLARFALASPHPEFGWYGDQLVFHLYSGFRDNRLFGFCNREQRSAVAKLLAHLIEQRTDLLDATTLADDILRCHALWSEE
jgi:hypothetical protein